MVEISSFFLPESEEEDCVYKEIRDGSKGVLVEWRNNVEELWESFKPFVFDQGQFRGKVQNQFYPFWWEMFLGSTFLKNGFKLEQVKEDEPDVCIEERIRKIWVEATMPERGSGDDCVPELQRLRETGGMASEQPNEKIILRYTNAVDEKRKQYQKRLNIDGRIKESDPYIIAIHSHYLNDNNSFGGIPLIGKAVYPVGNPYVTFLENPLETETGYHSRDKIFKKSGSDIETSVFLYVGDNDYKGISGILFSHKMPGQDIGSPPQKDFIFIHNYLAKNPIQLGSFKFAEEYFIEKQDDALELKPYEEKT